VPPLTAQWITAAQRERRLALTKQQIIEQINLANADVRAGRLLDAERSYLRLIKLRPRDAELLRRLGVVQGHLGVFDDAGRHLAKAVKLDPRRADLHLALAWIHVQAGRAKDAIDSYTRGAFFDPKSTEPACGLAAIYEKQNRLDLAEQHADTVLKAEPNNASAAVIKARVLRRRGDLDQAKNLLKRVLDADQPSDAGARFELGRIQQKLGEHDEAFATFALGNDVMSKTPAAALFNADAPMQRIDDFRAISTDRFASWKRQGAPDDGQPPLFLVGMPRSGTTMIEQMLSAHPDIAGSGETPILVKMVERLRSMFPDEPSTTRMLDSLTQAQIADLRGVYRVEAARILAQSPGKRRLLDKQPMQLISLPIISRVFPDARVIHALRDPRDVCLSCFFQEFAPNDSMNNFLSLDRTAVLYQAAMNLWLDQHSRYAFEPLEVRYERLTADTEPEIRRLIEFVGLEWDERVLSFHERPASAQLVKTPSYEAVSQPVHTRAVGRWRRYQKELAPILPILEPFVEAFGYEPSGTPKA